MRTRGPGRIVEQPMLSREAIAGFDLLSLPVWVFSVNSLQIWASNRAAQVWLGYDPCEL